VFERLDLFLEGFDVRIPTSWYRNV